VTQQTTRVPRIPRIPQTSQMPPRVGPTGPKRWHPNPGQRDLAIRMRFAGAQDKEIARVLRVSLMSLRRALGDDLDAAETLALSDVAQALLEVAKGGDVSAAKFILERRAAAVWGPAVTKHEVMGEGGGPVKLEIELVPAGHTIDVESAQVVEARPVPELDTG